MGGLLRAVHSNFAREGCVPYGRVVRAATPLLPLRGALPLTPRLRCPLRAALPGHRRLVPPRFRRVGPTPESRGGNPPGGCGRARPAAGE